jgi:DNA-binding transcriptional LysR family regulator
MPSSDIDWHLYRAFLAVLQEGSLSAAARALGSTQPSMGRHIATLEQALGLPLFTRSTEGLKPTPTALALREPAEAMAAAVAQAARIAQSGGVEQGCVRITASQIIGGEVLPELLARFQAMHPLVAIELVLNNRNDDLLKREADIAVRMAKPTQQALVARKLGRVDIGLYAHQRYAKARGLPRQLLELAQHTLIGADKDPATLRMAQEAGLPATRELFRFRCDSDLAQLAALRAGLGIGGCQIGLAKRHPEWLPVLPEQITFSMDMWLLTHSDLRRDTRVMALFRFLTEHLGAYALTSQRTM